MHSNVMPASLLTFKLRLSLAALGTTCAMFAVAPPAALAPPQLDQLLSPIALYPDPLLAQVLTASTDWDQIPEAATWADQHSYKHGLNITLTASAALGLLAAERELY
jgi:Protein of unknown function (DUF3300)